MDVLVANHFFMKVGGTETFCFALIQELKRRGHTVEYFTFFKGEVSDKIENELDVKFMSKNSYDLILANHFTTVRFLAHRGKIIQTCHGVYPALEQPSKFADGHIAISEEVSNYILKKGFTNQVILNGIDCVRFDVKNTLNPQLKKILSLCQSETANNFLREACKNLHVGFSQLDKSINPIWEVEKAINEADLVVGLGRSAYEAMACGRTVLVFDDRNYFDSFSDGYLNKDNVDNSIINNCSGRFFKRKLDFEQLVNELQKYNPQDGIFLRDYALEYINVRKQVQKYLDYADSIENTKSKSKFLIMRYQLFLYNFKMMRKLIKRNIRSVCKVK